MILTRAVGGAIHIGDDIVIQVLQMKGNQVRIGIKAPPDVVVDRAEIRERRQADARS